MPGVKAQYTPPGADKDVDQRADDERTKRTAAIDQAFAYYHGEQKLPLKTKDNVILNVNAQALDDMVEFLGVPRLELPGGVEREPATNDAGERVFETRKSDDQVQLEQWWDDHDLAEFLADLALSGFIAGHVFVRLYVDATDRVAAALLDPRTLTVFWDANNPRRLLWYRMSWIDGETALRQDIVPNSLLQSVPDLWTDGLDPLGWTILEYRHARAGWQLAGRDAWEFTFPPIVEWKNRHAPHSYYGRGDVKVALNDAINFVASNTSKIIKHHGGPQTVVTGGRLPDDVDSGPGTVIEITEPEAKVFNLEMQSDLGSSLAFLALLRESFFSEVRVVDLATIKDRLGQITNFGVRMLFIRMVNMLTTRRRLYGKGLAEISRRALALQGVEVARVNVTWPDLLPVDRRELVDTLEKESDLGVVSKQTMTEDLGRDFEIEQERRAEEGDDDRQAEADRLARIAERGGLMMDRDDADGAPMQRGQA
jgi:hypothetical protein